jgi:hypothetical protein
MFFKVSNHKNWSIFISQPLHEKTPHAPQSCNLIFYLAYINYIISFDQKTEKTRGMKKPKIDIPIFNTYSILILIINIIIIIIIFIEIVAYLHNTLVIDYTNM